jgi:hypothetical protein
MGRKRKYVIKLSTFYLPVYYKGSVTGRFMCYNAKLLCAGRSYTTFIYRWVSQKVSGGYCLKTIQYCVCVRASELFTHIEESAVGFCLYQQAQ